MPAGEPREGEEDANEDQTPEKVEEEFASEEDEDEAGADVEEVEEEFDDDDDDDGEFDVDRQLCPDESCVGVINAQGVCGECGASAGKGSGSIARADSSSESGGVDMIHRNLCPDGSCVGILGPDGRCKECGLVGENVLTDPRLRGLKTPPIAEKDDDSTSGAGPRESSEEVLSATNQPPEQSESFANRRLCPDGACIGIIGVDGTCKECGAVL